MDEPPDSLQATQPTTKSTRLYCVLPHAQLMRALSGQGAQSPLWQGAGHLQGQRAARREGGR